MEILLLSDFSHPPRGGTERHVMGVADYLASKGYGVHVLSPAGNGGGNTSYSVGGVMLHKFDFPFKGNFLVRAFLYLVIGILLVLKYRIRIIQGFYTMPCMIASAALAKITARRFIATLFEWELFDWQRRSAWKWPIARWAFSSADIITTIGPSFQRRMQAEFPQKDVREISNWVEDKFFSKSLPPRKPSERNAILFMGRLVENKGIYVLLEALAKIKGDAKFKLILAGPPIEQEKVKAAARELGILDRIDFRGFVSEKELLMLYRETDILAFPSILRGGMAFVVMEAMAMGKPVVCSDDIGLLEGVGEGGVVVRKGDAKALGKAILRLLTGHAFYLKCSKNAIQRARRLYSREKVLGKYVAAYRDLG